MSKKGFTLVEIMVGIAIIALLSTIGLVIYSRTTASARTSRITQDFDSMYKNIEQQRMFSQKTLGEVIGYWCTACNQCRASADLSNDPSCLYVMQTAWSKVTTAPLPIDPWGSPYVIDENENEFPSIPCRKDEITSAGPDKRLLTGDDINYSVPYFLLECP